MSDTPFKVPDSTLTRRFRRREGDWSQEGANNTLIVLGTDRAKSGGGPATVNDGNGSSSRRGDGSLTQGRFGAVHLVAGRVDPRGNPDLVADDSFLYLSSDSNIDENLATQDVHGGVGWINAQNAPAAALRSQNIRLVYRNEGDIRILSDGAKSFLVMNDKFVDWSVGNNFWLDVGGTLTEIQDQDNKNRIRMGPLVPGLDALLREMIKAITDSTVVSYTGNSGAPVPFNGDLKLNLLNALTNWRSAWIDTPGVPKYMKTGE